MNDYECVTNYQQLKDEIIGSFLYISRKIFFCEMNTQIVYVIVSSQNDIFLEELWASLFSLRHFHPEARVVVLADNPTAQRLNHPAFSLLLSMITEIKIVDVPEDYNGLQRSRDIKTNVRNIVNGSYLYIDTDTIITAPLDGIDSFEITNIAMVPDGHCYSVAENHIRFGSLAVMVKNIFDADIRDIPIYFNAGVQLVADNSLTREFFKKWHDNWQRAHNKGIDTDQQAYAYTDKCYGYITELLPDIYNCQVMRGAKHLFSANLIHVNRYRNVCLNDFPLQPFWEVYYKIKQDAGLSEEVKYKLINAKNQLSASSNIVGNEEMIFLLGKFYKLYKLNRFHLRWLIDKFNHFAERREYRNKIKRIK